MMKLMHWREISQNEMASLNPPRGITPTKIMPNASKNGGKDKAKETSKLFTVVNIIGKKAIFANYAH